MPSGRLKGTKKKTAGGATSVICQFNFWVFSEDPVWSGLWVPEDMD